jgi:GAF domain-containing protein
MLIDEGSGELYMRAVQGMGKKYTRFRQKVDDSMAGQVVRTGRPVRIGRNKGKESHEVMTGYLVRDLLNVPLQVRGKVIGVLGVDNISAQEGFTENDEYLLSALADYAAIAIDNSNLYELMEQRAHEITHLFESQQAGGDEELEQQLRVQEQQLEDERAHIKMIAEQLRLLGTQLEETQTRIKTIYSSTKETG